MTFKIGDHVRIIDKKGHSLIVGSNGKIIRKHFVPIRLDKHNFWVVEGQVSGFKIPLEQILEEWQIESLIPEYEVKWPISIWKRIQKWAWKQR